MALQVSDSSKVVDVVEKKTKTYVAILLIVGGWVLGMATLDSGSSTGPMFGILCVILGVIIYMTRDAEKEFKREK